MAFTLLSIISIGVSAVYADEHNELEVTVTNTGNHTAIESEVTVTLPHALSSITPTRCETQWEGFVPITYCSFRGVSPDGSEPRWDIQKEEWTSEIILEQEAKEEYEIFVAEQMKLTPAEKRIEVINALEVKEKMTDQQREERELLEKLGALCANDTLVSQTYRQFEVPTIIFRDHTGNMTQVLVEDKSIRTTNLKHDPNKDLKMQVQECIGQPHTKKSVQYDHIVVEETHKVHSDAAIGVPLWSQARVNQEANMPFKVIDKPTMCNSFNSDSTKRDYGCQDLRVYPDGRPAPVQQSYNETKQMIDFYKYQLDPDAQLEGIKSKVLREAQETAQSIGGKVSYDFDDDGVPNLIDRCPAIGSISTKGVDAHGCPIALED